MNSKRGFQLLFEFKIRFSSLQSNREIAVCVIVRSEFDSGADSLFTSTNHDDENALDLNII